MACLAGVVYAESRLQDPILEVSSPHRMVGPP
jgi:hypothetical protein